MIAWVASAPFTRSSSNHSSRKSAALMVNSRTSSCDVAPGPATEPAARARPTRASSRSPRFGGTTNSSSFTSPAIRAKYRSNSTNASASRLREFAMLFHVALRVAPQRQRGAVGERDEVVRRDDGDPVAEPLEVQLPTIRSGISETT